MKSENENIKFSQYSDYISWYNEVFQKNKKSPSPELVKAAEMFFFSEEEIKYADDNYRDNLCER